MAWYEPVGGNDGVIGNGLLDRELNLLVVPDDVIDLTAHWAAKDCAVCGQSQPLDDLVVQKHHLVSRRCSRALLPIDGVL